MCLTCKFKHTHTSHIPPTLLDPVIRLSTETLALPWDLGVAHLQVRGSAAVQGSAAGASREKTLIATGAERERERERVKKNRPFSLSREGFHAFANLIAKLLI